MITFTQTRRCTCTYKQVQTHVMLLSSMRCVLPWAHTWACSHTISQFPAWWSGSGAEPPECPSSCRSVWETSRALQYRPNVGCLILNTSTLGILYNLQQKKMLFILITMINKKKEICKSFWSISSFVILKFSLPMKWLDLMSDKFQDVFG